MLMQKDINIDGFSLVGGNIVFNRNSGYTCENLDGVLGILNRCITSILDGSIIVYKTELDYKHKLITLNSLYIGESRYFTICVFVYSNNKIHYLSLSNSITASGTDIADVFNKAEVIEKLLNLSNGSFRYVNSVLDLHKLKLLAYNNDYILVKIKSDASNCKHTIYYLFERLGSSFKFNKALKCSNLDISNIVGVGVLFGFDLSTGTLTKLIFSKDIGGYLAVEELDYKVKRITNSLSTNFNILLDNNDFIYEYMISKNKVAYSYRIRKEDLLFRDVTRSTIADSII